MGLKNSLTSNMNNPFRALRHRNFRLYWAGMCISLIGTWMQNIAQPWLAYTLTGSPFLLSLVGTLQFTPMLLFSLFAGVIIDRFPKKNILIITQSASLVVTLILALLVWTGRVQYWHILLMATLLGIINTIDMPTRQAFVIELVGKEDLMNAIALNSSIFNLARIIGPALAGLLMGYLGIAFCFFANSLSFAAVVISLFFIHPLPLQTKQIKTGNLFNEIKDGLKYIKQRSILWETLMVVAVVGIFAMNFSVLVPIFTTMVLKLEEASFGLLMSCMGVGSFLGAMFIASSNRPRRLIVAVGPLMIAGLLVLLGLSAMFALTGFLLALTGFFIVAFNSTANSTMQLNTLDEYRGRVMSVYTLTFAGSTPIGNLFAGLVTDYFGPSIGFAACGIMIAAFLIPLAFYRIRSRKQASEKGGTA